MKMMLKKAAFSALSFLGNVYQPGGVSILTYHSVDDEDSSISITTEMFRKQMKYLKENGISVISLDRLYDCLISSDTLPKNCVAITFDDGFEGVYKNAFPILKEFDFTATVFVVTDYVGKEMTWERVEGVPAYRLSTWDHLAEMSEGGIDIQSHTRTHPFLFELDEKALMDEVEGSMAAIEKHMGKRTRFLAYPYGGYNELVVKVLKRNEILGAVTATCGRAKKDQAPYALKRLGVDWVSGRDPDMLMDLFASCVSGTASAYVWLRNRSPLMVNRLGRGQYTKR